MNINPTAPKISYAKMGNKIKNRPSETSSTDQAGGRVQDKSDDLFSHMNPDNLNYIKKELKNKKNKSVHERARSSLLEEPIAEQGSSEGMMTHRQKIYHKYKDQEEVQERQPQLEQTDRKSTEIQRLIQQSGENEISPEDDSVQGNQSVPAAHLLKVEDQKQMLYFSHNNAQKFLSKRKDQELNLNRVSSPDQDQKKRISSIQGYFGQATSNHLNVMAESNFLDFLESYICDLNKSKSKYALTDDFDYKNESRDDSRGRHTSKGMLKQTDKFKINDLIEGSEDDLIKLDRLKRNADTLGQYNSRFTVNSNNARQNNHIHQLQIMLNKERLCSIILAEEIQKYKNSIKVKDQIISGLEYHLEMETEKVAHLKKNLQISQKNLKKLQAIQESNYLHLGDQHMRKFYKDKSRHSYQEATFNENQFLNAGIENSYRRKYEESKERRGLYENSYSQSIRQKSQKNISNQTPVKMKEIELLQFEYNEFKSKNEAFEHSLRLKKDGK